MGFDGLVVGPRSPRYLAIASSDRGQYSYALDANDGGGVRGTLEDGFGHVSLF